MNDNKSLAHQYFEKSPESTHGTGSRDYLISLVNKPLVTAKEMEQYGITPNYTEDMRQAMRERRQKINSVLRLPASSKIPKIDYPNKNPIKKWSDIVDCEDHRGTKDDFFANVEALDKDLKSNPDKKRKVRYLISQIKKSGKKLEVTTNSNGLKYFHIALNEAKTEKDLHILGKLYEKGVFAIFLTAKDAQDFFSTFNNIELFEKIVSVSERLRPNTRPYEGDIRDCYKAVQNMGSGFLDVILKACDKTENLKKEPYFKNYVTRGEIFSPVDYLRTDPYVLRLLNNISNENVKYAEKIINTMKSIKKNKIVEIKKMSLDYSVYFVDFVNKHKAKLDEVEFNEDFAEKNDVDSYSPEGFVLYLVYAPERLLHSNGLARGVTRRKISKEYSEEEMPYLVNLREYYKVEGFLSLRESDDIFDLHEKSAPLKFLSENKNFQEFIKENFEVRDLDHLSDITNKILEARIDPSFEEKMKAVKNLETVIGGEKKQKIDNLFLLTREHESKFIYWLVELYEKLDFNILSAIKDERDNGKVSDVKKWYENPEDFSRAIELGILGSGASNKSRIYNYEIIAEILHGQELLNFLQDNRDTHLLEITLDMSRFLTNIARKWLEIKEIFYQAKSLGIFSKDQLANYHNLEKFEAIKGIIGDKKFFAFLSDNNDLNLFQEAVNAYPDHTKDAKQYESLVYWSSDPEAFSIARKIGAIGGEFDNGDEKNIYKYKDLACLGKLNDSEIPRAKKVLEDMRTGLDLSKPTLEKGFPAEFVYAATKDENAYAIAAESNPFFAIKYDKKYATKGFYDNRLKWIAQMNPSVRGDFLEYLKAGSEKEKVKAFHGITLSNNDVSTEDISEQYEIPETEMKEIEQAFSQETAQWRERKKIIDFLELTNYRLQEIKQLEVLKRLAKKFDMDECANLYVKLCHDQENFEDEIHSFEIFVNYFGLSQIPFIYSLSKQILNRVIPREVEEFVSKTGKEGLSELRKYAQKSMHILANNEEEINPNECSKLDLEIYRYLLRFDTSQYHKGVKNKDFKENLVNLHKKREGGDIAPVADEYHTEKIDLLSVPKNVDLNKYAKSYVSSLGIIKNGLRENNFQRNKKELIHGLQEDISQKIKTLAQGAKKSDNRRREAIQSQIEKLSTLLNNLEEKNNHTEIIMALSSSIKFLPNSSKSIIQTIVIADYLEKNIEWKNKLKSITRESEIKIENINDIIEFLSILIKNHAIGSVHNTEDVQDWLYPNLDEKQRAQLKKLFSPKGLDEAQREFQQSQGVKLEDEYTLQPSRYIIGEMSGHLSDACYVSSPEILKNYPSMTPIACIKSPKTNPDIVGATLIFENTVNDGKDRVLLLVGVNPQDKLLKKASANSYGLKTISYANEVARKKGCKYVFAHTKNGVISNRPGMVTFFNTHIPEKELDGEYLQVGNVTDLDEKVVFHGKVVTKDCKIVSINEEMLTIEEETLQDQFESKDKLTTDTAEPKKESNTISDETKKETSFPQADSKEKIIEAKKIRTKLKELLMAGLEKIKNVKKVITRKTKA